MIFHRKFLVKYSKNSAIKNINFKGIELDPIVLVENDII
jgi:hypothetical protein